MTLKEKFDKVMVYPFSEYREQMKVIKEENSSEYEKIADEFAIGFAEWIKEEMLSKGKYNMIAKPTKELLEIYKKEIGL
jgi:hypothetical protein